MLKHLFDPGRIGVMELRNRITMAPMGSYQADEDGFVTDELIAFYVARAKGGTALIDTQIASIVPEIAVPNVMGLYDDMFIPGLTRLTEAVHAHGAKICQQLWHPGIGNEKLRKVREGNLKLYGASPLPFPRFFFEENPSTEVLSKRDIALLVEAYADTAARMKKAGFDAVEVHGAHGYLAAQFLSPLTNQRADEYGGCAEQRATFACEIITKIRQKVGADYPVIFRMTGSDFIEGGMTIEEAVRQAPLLAEAGADALSVSGGLREANPMRRLTYLHPPAAIVHLAHAVKQRVKVPVIAAGKLGDPEVANRVLQEGQCDFVALGRPLLADPELANKAKEGNLDRIDRCIFCCQCFERKDRDLYGSPLNCTVNPWLGKERQVALQQVAKPKKVVVVGGGLAGMKAAAVLAERGHRVSLFERGDRLGGQWNVATKQGHKAEFAKLAERLSSRLAELGVEVKLRSEVTRDVAQELKADAIVVATGAEPATLDVPGAAGKNVVQAVDVILGKAQVGDRPIVVGGRYLGMELAVELAEQGKKVKLITRRGLGRGVASTIRRVLRDRLLELDVQIISQSAVIEIRDNGVRVRPDDDDQPMFVRGDTVVLAVGSSSENRLQAELQGLAPEVYAIGDCVEPRDAFDAIHEATDLASSI